MAIVKKRCGWCLAEFYGTSRAVFCSSRCRIARHRSKSKISASCIEFEDTFLGTETEFHVEYEYEAGTIGSIHEPPEHEYFNITKVLINDVDFTDALHNQDLKSAIEAATMEALLDQLRESSEP